MVRANISESQLKERARIGRRLRELREERRLSQAELARRLSVSQGRLSQIEGGKASLTAEQFLLVLRIFQVSVTTFARPPSVASELQSTLARLGAFQLQEDASVLPSERLERVTEAIRETLVEPESPRLLTALAPVIVHNIESINWRKLTHDLGALGLSRRLYWLVENVREAVRTEAADPSVVAARRRLYSRVETVLADVSDLAERDEAVRGLPLDVLDRSIRTRRTRDEVSVTASPISQRWGIVTATRPDDFAEALRGARAGA